MAMWRGYVRRPHALCVGDLAARLPPAAALVPVGTQISRSGARSAWA